MRGEEQARNTLPVSCDGKWALPNARRQRTGPKTVAGLQRSQRANWKHGLYSAEAKAENRLIRQFLRDSRALLDRL